MINGKKPFRYFRMWKTHPSFLKVVEICWNMQIKGTKMYQLVAMLKRLKQLLKDFNRRVFSNIQKVDEEAYGKMELCQPDLQKDPLNSDLLEAK